MRKLVLLCLIAMVFLLGACAEPNSDAPAGGIHAMDGSFLDGSVHGPVAKQDLTFCQGCHGEAGGPGDNPRFNGGSADLSCEGVGCHDTNLAHPQDWAGPNNTFHYSAGNIQDACTLCHGEDLDGAGGAVGPSCLGCHDSAAAFTLDCTACHGYAPDGSPDLDVPTPVDHSDVPLGSHSECTICHGMSESTAGGNFEPSTFYVLFDKDTDTIGYHWDGSIQMNNSVAYNPSTLGCAFICHNNDDTQDPMPNASGLTVDLVDF